MSSPGRPGLRRLTASEAKTVQRIVTQMLDERGWTYADLDSALDRKPRWSQNALTRPKLAYKHAFYLVGAATGEPLCSTDLITEACQVIAALNRKYADPFAPPLLVFDADVPATAKALSSYLTENGFAVPDRLIRGFFEREIDFQGLPPTLRVGSASRALGIALIANRRDAMARNFSYKIWFGAFDHEDLIQPALIRIAESAVVTAIRRRGREKGS